MGKTKIDLGISTEEKPEWTISLDFDANNVVKDDLAEQSKEQEKTKGSRSIFNDALDSDFLSDDRSSFSDTQIPGGDSTSLAGGLDETIQSPGTGSSFENDGSSDSILGTANAAMLGGADDFLTTISTGADTGFENEVFLDPQVTDEKKNELPVMETDPTLQQDIFSRIPEEEEKLSEVMEQPMEEPVSEILNEIQEETSDRERDEVEEKLTHLVNSMDPWEQSENALSEAAAMLSKEGKTSAAGVDSEEKKLKDLFERLDISENLNRMNAVAQEDIADVIEQTQKDNELIEAIDVGSVEPADTVTKETEPESVLDMEPKKEETASLGEIEITNDMFDMGYDLSDEKENFSDENIDLDLFKGSLKDAEEFSSAENSLDLDVVEHTGQYGAELDMSNLVEAAMSGLSGSYEGENIEIPEPEESLLSEAEFNSEPEESTLSEAEFNSEPEESTLSEAEFISGPEESVYQSLPVEFQPDSTEQEEEPMEDEAAPEELKLEFEPVYPEGQGPNLAGILNDTGDGDVASMIIEDYSEVPTVSDIETKLKKREREKKKNKSKESQQKKTDGFAYSLDDINTKTTDHIEQTEEKTLVGREAVKAALEVAAETATAEGASKAAESQSEEFTASVYARHVVHKEGKIKRSYFSLFYK